VRSSPDSDLPFDSSSDDGDDDDDYHDDDTNTHALHQHFHCKCGGCKFPFSFDGDEGDGDSGDDDDDDNLSRATFSSLASSGDSSSYAHSTICGNDPNQASCTSNPSQPSSNQNAFGRSDDTDVVLLSCTNNSLQQCISSSDSSSLIGLHHNLECNARAKANSYKVGNDSKLPYPCWLQVVTPPLLLLPPLVEMILIRPVVLPILSNQVVTGMLSVTAMTLMSCCCHALTTLCNNAFLLLTPPRL
jgi:hypothetical protein